MCEKVLKNKKIFEKCLNYLDKETNEEQIVILSRMFAQFATKKHTGYFSSSFIEKKLIQVAENIKTNIQKSDSYEEKSFLHVLSTAYITGGHTRVVERWIENQDNKEKHSVLLLEQGSRDIPKKLKKFIEIKNGELIIFNNENYIKKASMLREFAQNYEYIILHHHMYDPIPILAFGSTQTTRPVILFNHASHLFWLGVSIADIVADIMKTSQNLSINRRKVRKSLLLPIPIQENTEKINKIESRKKLNLPIDQKIILSIAAPYKYKKFDKYDFIYAANTIIKNTQNTIFLVIGPNKNMLIDWNKAYKDSNNKIIALGLIPSNEIHNYIASADLYIDSFPVSSGTALLDAGMINNNILCLKTPHSNVDSVLEAGIQCETTAELIDKAVKIINEETEFPNNLYENIKKYNSKENWQKFLENILKETPNKHSVDFLFKENTGIDEYDLFLNESLDDDNNIGFIDFDCFKKLNLKNKFFILNTLLFGYKVNNISSYIKSFLPEKLKEKIKETQLYNLIKQFNKEQLSNE